MSASPSGQMARLERIRDLSLQGPRNDQDARRFYEDLVRNDRNDAISLSEREQQVLGLYDSVKELELECSLLEAQKTVQPGDLRSRQQGDASADPRQCLLTMWLRRTTWTISSGELKETCSKPRLLIPYGTRSSKMSS